MNQPKRYCHCGSEIGKGVCLDGASVVCREMPDDPDDEWEAERLRLEGNLWAALAAWDDFNRRNELRSARALTRATKKQP